MVARLVYVERDGAVLRGPSRPWPEEVWSPARRGWIPYQGPVPKAVDWGDVISEEEAQRLTGGAV